MYSWEIVLSLRSGILGLGGSRCTLLADSFQQHTGGFVGGVWGHDLAGEGLLQDRLAKGRAPFQGSVDLPLVLLDHTKLLVELPHEFRLLWKRTNGKKVAAY